MSPQQSRRTTKWDTASSSQGSAFELLLGRQPPTSGAESFFSLTQACTCLNVKFADLYRQGGGKLPQCPNKEMLCTCGRPHLAAGRRCNKT